MKLRFIGSRNPSAIYRYSPGSIPEETDAEDNTTPLEDGEEESELSDNGIPDDMGNRLPSGGRSGNKKVDKFQGYRTPPMY